MTVTQIKELDGATRERIEAILEDIASLGLERGWSREDVAVAMALGAGDLCARCSPTPADLDRSIGAVMRLIRSRAMQGGGENAGPDGAAH